MRGLLVLLGLALPAAAAAQAGSPPLPQKHIPAPVLLEMRALDVEFEQALRRDCAPERCASKGCAYRDHIVVDLPRSSSLPGLGASEGLGSVPPQEYLTQAQCGFAHEKSVSNRDVQALVRRLEQLLSKGFLKVTVTPQVLEPISPALAESPPPKPETPPPPPPPPVEPPKPPPAPEPPQEWKAEVALRELWVALLPHFSWMIALVLGTLAALTLIWAARRLGRETLEEKAMAAQLQAGALGKDEQAAPAEPEKGPEAAPEPAPVQAALALPSAEDAAREAFLTEQRKLWGDRIARAELGKEEGGVIELLRGWLKERQFPLLAKALFVLGERVSLAFPTDGKLAAHKVEFADYLRTLDEKALPSDEEFFGLLNRHAVSSSLLAQPDAETYRSLREEFGAAGLAHLMERLPSRQAALLYAMAPPDGQSEVARMLPAERRARLAEELLRSNRIAREEQEEVFAALESARAGLPLPKPSEPLPHQILDRGLEYDAAGALSTLLPQVEPEARGEILARALQRSSGALPLWYEDILFPEMLLKLPEELRTDLLLEVDVRGLAGWSSVQPAASREDLLSRLSPAVQSAVRANQAFGSRSEQLRQAQSGREALVAGLKRLAARGKVSFTEMLG